MFWIALMCFVALHFTLISLFIKSVQWTFAIECFYFEVMVPCCLCLFLHHESAGMACLIIRPCGYFLSSFFLCFGVESSWVLIFKVCLECAISAHKIGSCVSCHQTLSMFNCNYSIVQFSKWILSNCEFWKYHLYMSPKAMQKCAFFNLLTSKKYVRKSVFLVYFYAQILIFEAENRLNCVHAWYFKIYPTNLNGYKFDLDRLRLTGFSDSELSFRFFNVFIFLHATGLVVYNSSMHLFIN